MNFETEIEPQRGSATSRALRDAVYQSMRTLSDIIIPPVCVLCREPLGTHDALCPSCWREIDFIRPPLCDRLGLPLPFSTGTTMISAAAVAKPPRYERARAVARYDGAMSRLIKDFKFHDRHDLRSLLVSWMMTVGAELIVDADIVIPVPLSRFRLFTRRFNQSAILARDIAKRSGLEFSALALSRTRHTKPQAKLKGTERQTNVRGAFAVPARARRQIADRRVLLIDDVITTGATVDACTRALVKVGAESVDVLTVAMVTDRGRVTL